MIKTNIITVESSDAVPELIDITLKVEDLVLESGIRMGQVLVFARHTTAGIIIQEPEPGIHKDLHQLLHSLAPKEADYHHAKSSDHLKDKMPNGHSHIQHILLGASEIIPISGGKMLLGTYQRIFLIELDRARLREIVIQISGE